jgi:RecA/RadA recombinase
MRQGRAILMSKFNMGGLASDIRKHFKDNPKLSKRIGVGSNLSKLTDADYIKLPQWWKDATGVPGLPFGKLVMIAGDSDSGKTSMAIEAMKAAQAQDVGIIYVETEGKTTEADLRAWGVNPDEILLIQSSIAEEAFELLFAAWDGFKSKYPGARLLIIFDSIGNVVSQRDSEIDLTEQDSKPGGKGKINRLAINKMVSKRDEDNAALLIINYTYDNIGSPGKTNAGGKAVNFFSSLTFQTSRKGWYEKTVKGEKVRAGADVVWKLFKNHLAKSSLNKKEFTLRITSEGISCVGAE